MFAEQKFWCHRRTFFSRMMSKNAELQCYSFINLTVRNSQVALITGGLIRRGSLAHLKYSRWNHILVRCMMPSSNFRSPNELSAGERRAPHGASVYKTLVNNTRGLILSRTWCENKKRRCKLSNTHLHLLTLDVVELTFRFRSEIFISFIEMNLNDCKFFFKGFFWKKFKKMGRAPSFFLTYSSFSKCLFLLA